MDNLMRFQTIWAKRIMLLTFTALVLFISMKVWGIDSLEPMSRAFLWLIACLPLILFLPGLVRGNWKTCLWLCFVLLLYFSIIVTHLFMPGASTVNWLQLIALLLLFVSAMMFSRWRQQELKPSGPTP